MTTWTLSKNSAGFSQILKEQSCKKDIWFTNPIAMLLNYENPLTYTPFSNFAIKYLTKTITKKFAKSVLPVQYGAQVKLKKKGQTSRDTVPFIICTFLGMGLTHEIYLLSKTI